MTMMTMMSTEELNVFMCIHCSSQITSLGPKSASNIEILNFE